MNEQATIVAEKPRRKRRWFWYLGIGFLVLIVWQVVSWLTPVPAPLASAAAVTDKVYEAVYSDEIMKRAAELPADVNILVVGLDNRLASHDNHADAIHLICIHTKDSVSAQIISIPRGTEVSGYGITDDLSFMANVRALKGRNTFIKAVSRLTGKKVNYYVEVTFSQVMGVLELLGYKDPATALQFLRHRKSYALGDVQRSYNQGKFIRTQIIRRADLLTGAKGDLLMRMGLGMVDTDLDLNTVQAIVYLLKERNALNDQRISQTMKPKINLARLDSVAIPEPDEMQEAVSKLVRRTGDQIDDLGRYNPYPRINEVISRAEQQKSARAALAIIEPVYEQKAWLQVQERPQRQELRDRVENVLIRAYTETNKQDKISVVKKYMTEERQAFQDIEREARRFSYGRRPGVHKKEGGTSLDPVAAARAKQDEIGQKQTRIEPQAPSENNAAATRPAQNTDAQQPAANGTVEGNTTAPHDGPQVQPLNPDASHHDAPNTNETPKSETPKSEAPKSSEAPRSEAPKSEAPKHEVTQAQPKHTTPVTRTAPNARNLGATPTAAKSGTRTATGNAAATRSGTTATKKPATTKPANGKATTAKGAPAKGTPAKASTAKSGAGNNQVRVHPIAPNGNR